MRNVLILDTETTGLHPSQGALLIEIGALLYNIEHRVVVQTLSGFLPCQTNEVENINHIKAEWTRQCYPKWTLDGLCGMSDDADAIVAHNAQFDESFLKINVIDDDFWKLPWICTKNDFQWPVKLARNRLQDVCVAMGVQYLDAHRALIDCQFIADCFSRVPDLKERLEKCVK